MENTEYLYKCGMEFVSDDYIEGIMTDKKPVHGMQHKAQNREIEYTDSITNNEVN